MVPLVENPGQRRARVVILTGREPSEGMIWCSMLWWTLRKLRSTDARERVAAIRQLGSAPDQRAITAITERLSDDAFDVRREAAEALVPVVIDIRPLLLLAKKEFCSRSTATTHGVRNDRDGERVESWAVDLAARLNALDQLCEWVKDKDYRTRVFAARALARMGAPAVERLLRESRTRKLGDDDYTWTAIRDVRDPHATDLLISALGEGHQLSGWIAEALGEIGDSRAIEPLVSAMMAGRASSLPALVKLKWVPKTAEHRARLAIHQEKYKNAAAEGTVSAPLLASALLWKIKRDPETISGDDVIADGIAAFVSVSDAGSIEILYNIFTVATKRVNRYFDNEKFQTEPAKPRCAAAANDGLCRLLERFAQNVLNDILAKIAQLEDPIRIRWQDPKCESKREVSRTPALDLSRLRQLAKQELARRTGGAASVQ